MRKYTLAALVALLWATQGLRAAMDNIRFTNISIFNGLPHNGIYDVRQDSRGFIWIGTREGLSRYDGHAMECYFYEADNDKTIPHNTIRNIFEDSSHRLWIATEGGICYYDRDQDNFIRVPVSENHNNFGLSITELKGGRLLASTARALLEYDPAKSVFVPFFQLGEPSPFQPTVNNMVEDGSGVLWIGTPRGIHCLDPATKQSVGLLDRFKNSGQLRPATIHTVCKDASQRIWFGGTDGAFIYDPAAGTLRHIEGLRNRLVRSIEFSGSGEAWIGGESGLDIIDGSGQIRHIGQGVSDVTNLSDNAVYVIYKDNSGNMWVGTYFGGINLMIKYTSEFSTYPYGFSDRHLSGKAVRQIIADGPNSLWIATEDGGLNHFDRSTRKFAHYTGKRDRIALNYHNVHSLLRDSKGNLWIGTFTGGINKYDPRTGRTTYPKCIKNGNESSLIFCFLEDNDGDMWIGTSTGMFVQRAGSDKIEVSRIGELTNNFIYTMALDSKGLIWIGTRRNGLIQYDKRQNAAIRIPGDNVFQNFVPSVFIDDKDNVWVGTSGGGVRFLERSKEEFRSFTTADGLPSDVVMGIVQDNDGHIWISTNRGLCRFDPNRNAVVNYTVDDGLPIDLFNYSSAFRAADGELFFGSVNGMISFYPDKLTKEHNPLKMEIMDFRLRGQTPVIGATDSPLTKNITETSRIVLRYKDAASFSFSYTALNYSHSSGIKYAFRMEPSTEWQYVEKQHQILFSGLRHGKYRLGIKASYDGIEWDNDGIRYMDIEILPPFYLSSWALLIYLALLGGLATGVYLFVDGRLKMRHKISAEQSAKMHAEELNRQKMIFFGNISHDLKTPLTLVMGPLQKSVNDRSLGESQRGNLKVVLQNAYRMRNLLEELVMLSKIEMDHMKVTVQQGDLMPFIDRICDIFRIFAGDNGINFFVNIEPTDQKVWFSPMNIERIVNNLLSNAFKFTPSGGVIWLQAGLAVKQDGMTYLDMTVRDTGCGIAPDEQEKIFENYYTIAEKSRHNGAGIGLALTKSLVLLHKGAISVGSKETDGATFSISVNVSREAYTADQVSELPAEENMEVTRQFARENNSYLQEARTEIQNRETKRPLILIVEDNHEVSEFVRRIFERDFDTALAYDGLQGYETAMHDMPDLIISDVMMPEMDGLELTRKLKAEFITSHIPIVILTAKTEEYEKIEGFEYGADAYIEKPFNPQRLELQVRNLLNTRSSNAQRFKRDTKFDSKKLTKNLQDEKFLNNIAELIMRNLDNDNFSVKDITDALGVSRTVLHIKLKSLTDLSATEFIRNIRMKEAREKMLGGMNVSEASFAVGMSDPNYFTKCFKKQFGQTPSDFIRTLKNQ